MRVIVMRFSRFLRRDQRGQVSFLGNSTVRQPRLSVGSSFPRCSRRVVRVLKLCHYPLKTHLVRDRLAGANVFFAKHGNLYGAHSPLAGAVECVTLVVVDDEQRAVLRLGFDWKPPAGELRTLGLQLSCRQPRRRFADDNFSVSLSFINEKLVLGVHLRDGKTECANGGNNSKLFHGDVSGNRLTKLETMSPDRPDPLDLLLDLLAFGNERIRRLFFRLLCPKNFANCQFICLGNSSRDKECSGSFGPKLGNGIEVRKIKPAT